MAQSPDVSASKPKRRVLVGLLSILFVFSVVGVLSARSILPQTDEAVLANPGYNLLYHGSIGTTIYELRGYMPLSMSQRTYWQPPVYFVLTSGWFSLVGFGLMQVRMLSLVFGAVGLVSWYLIAFKLTGARVAGLSAMGLVSVDYFYVSGASTGRMDMVCCGLGAAALATYLVLREQSKGLALLWSHVFAAMCVLTHPAGLLYWLCLAFMVLKMDWRSLSPKVIGMGLVPVLVAGVLFGSYILTGLDMFREQMSEVLRINSASFDDTGLSQIRPIRSLQLEWRHRYEAPFGLGPGVGAAQRSKALILAAYLAALSAGLLRKRNRQQKWSIVCVFVLIAALYLGLVSPSKFSYYLPHVTSFMAACLGLVLYSSRESLGRYRWLATVAFIGIVVVQLVGSVYRIYQKPLSTILFTGGRAG